MKVMKYLRWGSLLLIVLCFAYSVLAGIQKYNFLKSAVVADAEIVEMIKSPDADDEYVTPVLLYSYEGQQLKVMNPFMVDDAQFKLKQVVPIIINPIKPEMAQMKTAAFQYYPSSLSFLFAVLASIIYLLLFPIKRKLA